MLLEVIATTVEDAITAESCGADRIELITAFTEGGLTPSIGLVASVLEAVAIPVRVMVRPHSRSFVYSNMDIQTMLADIRQIRAVGGKALVLGVLQPDGRVNEAVLQQLLAEADRMQVTFHRAFDEVPDQMEALDILGQYPQITDVLTSGGCSSAPEGVRQLRDLHAYEGRGALQLLAGSGLSEDNIPWFMKQSSLTRIHVGSAVRRNGHVLEPLDPERLLRIRELIRT